MKVYNGANHPRSEPYFLLILLVGIFGVTFFIFKPFLYALILATVFATVFKPVHKRILILTRGGRSLAALLTTVLVFTIVVTPLVFFGIQTFQEATKLYTFTVQNDSMANLSRSVDNTLQDLKKLIPVSIELSFDLNQYVSQGLNWLLRHFDLIFSNIAKVLINIFVFLVALYYLFKDGHKFKAAIVSLSPFQDIHDETIFNKLELAINSVFKGNLAIAFIQGALTVVGFTIFGVPGAVLWGSIAIIAALIPNIGTALVLTPAIIFLFVSGKTLFAVGLLLWGITVVGLIDNFLGPKLIERGMRLHSFLILLSILGGVGFFGPLGFLLGPLVLSLLFTLFELYFTLGKEEYGD